MSSIRGRGGGVRGNRGNDAGKGSPPPSPSRVNAATAAAPAPPPPTTSCPPNGSHDLSTMTPRETASGSESSRPDSKNPAIDPQALPPQPSTDTSASSHNAAAIKASATYNSFPVQNAAPIPAKAASSSSFLNLLYMRVRTVETITTSTPFKIHDSKEFQLAILKLLAGISPLKESGLFTSTLEMYLSRHTESTYKGHYFTLGFMIPPTENDADPAASLVRMILNIKDPLECKIPVHAGTNIHEVKVQITFSKDKTLLSDVYNLDFQFRVPPIVTAIDPIDDIAFLLAYLFFPKPKELSDSCYHDSIASDILKFKSYCQSSPKTVESIGCFRNRTITGVFPLKIDDPDSADFAVFQRLVIAARIGIDTREGTQQRYKLFLPKITDPKLPLSLRKVIEELDTHPLLAQLIVVKPARRRNHDSDTSSEAENSEAFAERMLKRSEIISSLPVIQKSSSEIDFPALHSLAFTPVHALPSLGFNVLCTPKEEGTKSKPSVSFNDPEQKSSLKTGTAETDGSSGTQRIVVIGDAKPKKPDLPLPHETWTRVIREKCLTLIKTGSCAKGDKCQYSHNVETKTMKPTTAADKKPSTTPSPLCRAFSIYGTCKAGIKCKFEHTRTETSKVNAQTGAVATIVQSEVEDKTQEDKTAHSIQHATAQSPSAATLSNATPPAHASSSTSLDNTEMQHVSQAEAASAPNNAAPADKSDDVKASVDLGSKASPAIQAAATNICDKIEAAAAGAADTEAQAAHAQTDAQSDTLQPGHAAPHACFEELYGLETWLFELQSKQLPDLDPLLISQIIDDAKFLQYEIAEHPIAELVPSTLTEQYQSQRQSLFVAASNLIGELKIGMREALLVSVAKLESAYQHKSTLKEEELMSIFRESSNLSTLFEDDKARQAYNSCFSKLADFLQYSHSDEDCNSSPPHLGDNAAPFVERSEHNFLDAPEMIFTESMKAKLPSLEACNTAATHGIRTVPGDGKCLFVCILEAACSFNIGIDPNMTADAFRALVIHFLRINRNQPVLLCEAFPEFPIFQTTPEEVMRASMFSNLKDGTPVSKRTVVLVHGFKDVVCSDFEEYVEAMSRPTAYGGTLEIMAIAAICKINIIVYAPNFTVPITSYLHPAAVGTVVLINESKDGGSHFNWLHFGVALPSDFFSAVEGHLSLPDHSKLEPFPSPRVSPNTFTSKILPSFLLEFFKTKTQTAPAAEEIFPIGHLPQYPPVEGQDWQEWDESIYTPCKSHHAHACCDALGDCQHCDGKGECKWPLDLDAWNSGIVPQPQAFLMAGTGIRRYLLSTAFTDSESLFLFSQISFFLDRITVISHVLYKHYALHGDQLDENALKDLRDAIILFNNALLLIQNKTDTLSSDHTEIVIQRLAFLSQGLELTWDLIEFAFSMQFEELYENADEDPASQAESQFSRCSITSDEHLITHFYPELFFEECQTFLEKAQCAINIANNKLKIVTKEGRMMIRLQVTQLANNLDESLGDVQLRINIIEIDTRPKDSAAEILPKLRQIAAEIIKIQKELRDIAEKIRHLVASELAASPLAAKGKGAISKQSPASAKNSARQEAQDVSVGKFFANTLKAAAQLANKMKGRKRVSSSLAPPQMGDEEKEIMDAEEEGNSSQEEEAVKALRKEANSSRSEFQTEARNVQSNGNAADSFDSQLGDDSARSSDIDFVALSQPKFDESRHPRTLDVQQDIAAGDGVLVVTKQIMEHISYCDKGHQINRAVELREGETVNCSFCPNSFSNGIFTCHCSNSTAGPFYCCSPCLKVGKSYPPPPNCPVPRCQQRGGKCLLKHVPIIRKCYSCQETIARDAYAWTCTTKSCRTNMCIHCRSIPPPPSSPACSRFPSSSGAPAPMLSAKGGGQ